MARATGSRFTRICLAVLTAAMMALIGGIVAMTTPQAAAAPKQDGAPVPGMDVSSYQGNVDWKKAYQSGARFAYVKATESTNYTNPYFEQQYDGSYNVGMIRGAYHFAHPGETSAAAQANFFVKNGGGWSADGKTLPPMLDIEYNPNGATCYGLSQSAMVNWIKAFSTRMHQLTNRYPMIYTTTDWWQTCTGNAGTFGATHPLFVARYANQVGPLPNGWKYYTLWQYSDEGPLPGDQNVFNGTLKSLLKLALGDNAPQDKPTTSARPTTPARPTKSTTPSTRPTSSKSSAPPSSSTPNHSSSSSSASAAPPLIPLSKKSSSAPPSDTKVQGLAWTGTDNRTPPRELPDSDGGSQLVAQAAPLKVQKADVEPAPTTSTVQPVPEQAPVAQAEPQTEGQRLASTGATNTARFVVFGAALVILGTILLLLLRSRSRRSY